MTEEEEKFYMRGRRAAYREQLSNAIRELGNPEQLEAEWRIERADVIACLRSACDNHGDNDWRDELHLGDVIQKHLIDYLDAPESTCEWIWNNERGIWTMPDCPDPAADQIQVRIPSNASHCIFCGNRMITSRP